MGISPTPRSKKQPWPEQIASLDFDVRLIDFGSSTALNPVDPTFTTRAYVWRGGTPVNRAASCTL